MELAAPHIAVAHDARETPCIVRARQHIGGIDVAGRRDGVVDAPPVGLPVVTLGIAELSALLLGGVSAVTLARAGRLHADDPARIARLFATTVAPRLSFWY